MAHPKVRVWSGSYPEGPKWLRGLPGGQAVVKRLSQRSGSSREAFPEVRVAHPEVREWSGGYPERPRVVGRPSRRSWSGWEALPEVRE